MKMQLTSVMQMVLVGLLLVLAVETLGYLRRNGYLQDDRPYKHSCEAAGGHWSTRERQCLQVIPLATVGRRP